MDTREINRLNTRQQVLSSLQDLNQFWVEKNGDIAFIDPSMQEVGPTYALIKSHLLKEWLNKNDLQLIWLVGRGKAALYRKRNKILW